MANVVILGAGLMGTAISTPLADNGHQVHLVGTHLDSDIIEEIHQNRRHPKLGVIVHENVIPFTHLGLGQALQDVDLLILGVNSLGIAWASEQLAQLLPEGVPVVAVTKGLAGQGAELRLLTEVFRDGLRSELQSTIKLAAIGGPSIAGELAVRRDTCVVLTGHESSLLHQLAAMLRTSYYHVWTSTDMIGVEVSVALKNLYALAVGMVQGLLEKEGAAENKAKMHNLSAAIFAQGLWETATFVEYMGGSLTNVYSLPGAGDLFVTVMGGRNVRLGRFLGLGMDYPTAKAQHFSDDTVEGAELAQAIGDTVELLIARNQVNPDQLPLFRTVVGIVCSGDPVEIPWSDFFHPRYGDVTR